MRHLCNASAVILSIALGTLPAQAAQHASTCWSGTALLPGASHLPNQAISGEYFTYVELAYSDWQKTVSRGRYKIQNQSVTIVKAPTGLYEVTFVPRRGKVSEPGGSSQYGREVVYVIDGNRDRIVCKDFPF